MRPAERDRRRPGQFAELLAVGVGCHGDMLVARRRESEQALQPDLPASRVHQVDSADDFGDALLMVIHDDRQVIGDESVAAPHDEIAGFGLEPLLVGALQAVDEAER